MKVIVIGNYAPSLISFRGALLSELVAKGHEVIACAPGECPEVALELSTMGVNYKPIYLSRTSINPLRDLVFFIHLIYLFIRYKPNIILNYTIKPVIYGSIAARLVGITNVYSIITGLGYLFIGNELKQKFLRFIASGVYRKALTINKVVFFLNPDDLKLFNELTLVGPQRKTVLVNGEGINLDYYTKGLITAKSDDSFNVILNGSGIDLTNFPHVLSQFNKQVFLLIARLIKDKGIIEFVEAARILKNKYPQAVFQLVGPVDSNPTAIEFSDIQKWHQEGVIEYLGETKDVRPYIANASVYVLPSYREGTPRTVLEAMAMGRPIVTTDAPGCRETVREGENGFLVPVRDSEALARAMEKFIVNPCLCETMGQRSREIAEEKYDVNKVNRVILNSMGLSQ